MPYFTDYHRDQIPLFAKFVRCSSSRSCGGYYGLLLIQSSLRFLQLGPRNACWLWILLSMRSRLWRNTCRVREPDLFQSTCLENAHIIIGEGDGEPNWTTLEDDVTHDFAPRGASKFQDRVRHRLPKPFTLYNPSWMTTFMKLYGTCSVWSCSSNSR